MFQNDGISFVLYLRAFGKSGNAGRRLQDHDRQIESLESE